MKTESTFTATIYVGFKEHDTAILHTLDEARAICQAYCNEFPWCVTLMPTEYIYKNGEEPGCIVGLINYPRFPATPETIRGHALALGERLRQGLGQWKVSVALPDETVMLEEADALPSTRMTLAEHAEAW